MKRADTIKAMLQKDEGAILILWAVSLAVVLGIVALSFDFGRKASTQSELQSYADQVALAAAGELDGKSDAITRATNAAANLIVDKQTFATGSHALAGNSNYTLTFYKSLPSSDTASMASGSTTNPALAAFAKVVVTPRTVPFTFMAAFDVLRGSATPNPAIGASAVAGFTQFACDITPLMFCIPSPSFKAKDNIGKMIKLRAGGGGAAFWGPGDFGFLDPSGLQLDPGGNCAGLNGAQKLACLVGGSGALTQCFSQRGVNTEPGQKVGLENSAFNTRFDIYNSMLNSKQNNPIYAPAPNVIKGIKKRGGGSGNCIGTNFDRTTDTWPLPRDNCFYTSNCANGNRFGDGVWNNATNGRPKYVLKNYGGTDPHPSAATRYDYYKAEIAAHGGAGSSTRILPAGRTETGRPMCSNQQSNDPDRRVVIAAGIDCTTNPVKGSMNNVPVQEFVKLFMTEIVGLDDPFDMYVEVVGSAESGSAGSGGIFHDVVQLYR